MRKVAELVALAIGEILALRQRTETLEAELNGAAQTNADLQTKLDEALANGGGNGDLQVTNEEAGQLELLFPESAGEGDGGDTVADDGGEDVPAEPVPGTPLAGTDMEANFLISSPEGQPDGRTINRPIGQASGTSPNAAVSRFRADNPHLRNTILKAHKQ